VEESDAPPIKLGLLRYELLTKPTNLQPTHITTGTVNALCCSTYIPDASIKSSHSYTEALLGK
jgi:hypothetical protein